MGDMGDDFRAWKQQSISHRAERRLTGAAALASAGVQFESKNDGAHLILSHDGSAIDFWPGTDRWHVRGGKWGRGVSSLLKLVATTGSEK